MAKVEYEVMVSIQARKEDLQRLQADLKRSLLDTKQMNTDIIKRDLSKVYDKGANIGLQSFQGISDEILNIRSNLEDAFAVPGKITPGSLKKPWLELLLVVEQIDSLMNDLVSKGTLVAEVANKMFPGKNITSFEDINKRWFGKNAARGEEMKKQLAESLKLDPSIKQLENYKRGVLEVADAVSEFKDNIVDQTNALDDNAAEQAKVTAESNKLTNEYKRQKEESQGKWLVMTPFGGALQGINLGLSTLQGNIQGMVFSLMFANTKFIALALGVGSATLAIGVFIKTISLAIRTVVGLVMGVVKLAFTIGTTLVRSVVNAATIIGTKISQFIVGSVKEASDSLIRLRDDLMLVNDSLLVGSGDYIIATKTAEEYGRNVTDVSRAVLVLRKNYLGVTSSLKAVMLLAARNNMTVEEAASAYSQMIGMQSEATKSARQYGVVIDEIAEGTSRAAVTEIVNSAIFDQLSGSAEQFKNSASGAIESLKAEWERFKLVVATPIWDELITPLVKTLTPILKGVREQVAALFDNINFGQLATSLSSVANSLKTAFDVFNTKFGDQIGIAIQFIIDKITELSFILGQVDWDDVYTKASNAFGKITAYIAGFGVGVGIVFKTILDSWGFTTKDLKEATEEFTSESKYSWSEMASSMSARVAFIATDSGIYFERIKLKFSALCNAMKMMWHLVLGSITLGLGDLLIKIGEVLGEVLGWVGRLGGKLGNSFLEGFGDVGESIAGSAVDFTKTVVPNVRNVDDYYNAMNTDLLKEHALAVTQFSKAWDAGNDAFDTSEDLFERMNDEIEESINYYNMLSEARRLDALEARDWADDAEGASQDIGKSLEYVAHKAGSTSNEVKSEIESLIKAWQGLVRGVMKPTMDFDFSSWQDQMTTSYDSMGRDFGKETGFGRQDVWDEPVRRMLDIVNRGGESPWAKVMVPPADIMAKGNDAIKAWAAENVRQFQLGMRPDMIDWEAFVQSLREQVESKGNWENIYKIAEAKAQEAGLGVTSAQVQAALGVTLSPEAAGALQMGQNIADLFELQMQDVAFAETVAGSMATSFEANQTLFHNNARSVANTWIDAYIEGMDERGGELVAALDPLISARIEAYLINRAGTSGHGD